MISFFDVGLILLVYLIVFIIIIVSEYFRKKNQLNSKVTRHAIHLFAGDNMLLLPFFSALVYPLTIPVGLALFMINSFHRRKKSMMSRTMIVDEYDKYHAYGPLYYILSIMILLIVAWNFRHIAMAAVMIMAWGDGAASVLGPRFKKRHLYPNSSKSLEGSLAMFIFAMLGASIAMIIAFQSGLIVSSIAMLLFIPFIGSLIGTISEACSIGPLKPFDNFTVPLSAAAVMYLFTSFI
jgi:phytol kinase